MSKDYVSQVCWNKMKKKTKLFLLAKTFLKSEDRHQKDEGHPGVWTNITSLPSERDNNYKEVYEVFIFYILYNNNNKEVCEVLARMQRFRRIWESLIIKRNISLELARETTSVYLVTKMMIINMMMRMITMLMTIILTTMMTMMTIKMMMLVTFLGRHKDCNRTVKSPNNQSILQCPRTFKWLFEQDFDIDTAADYLYHLGIFIRTAAVTLGRMYKVDRPGLSWTCNPFCLTNLSKYSKSAFKKK